MVKRFRNTLILVATFVLVVVALALFPTNNQAHTAEVALERASAATAQEFSSFKQVNSSSQKSNLPPKITAVQQIPDISQNASYYEALRSLIERYGVDVTLPDKTFKGDQPLTRGDFVVYLNDSLTVIENFISAAAANVGDVSTLTNDLEQITAKLTNERRSIEEELTQIKARLSELERKVVSNPQLRPRR